MYIMKLSRAGRSFDLPFLSMKTELFIGQSCTITCRVHLCLCSCSHGPPWEYKNGRSRVHEPVIEITSLFLFFTHHDKELSLLIFDPIVLYENATSSKTADFAYSGKFSYFFQSPFVYDVIIPS